MIDPRAVVSEEAIIALGVEIGPFTVIGPGVEIAAGTRVGPHVVINGPTRIGRDNQIFQFCSIGDAPQDKKYAGEPTRLEIGDRNTFREFCTVNRGTTQDEGVTRIGNDNWIMAYAHIAHDCLIGDNVIMANAATLAGHVHVGDWAVLGGFAKVHQFCRVGTHAFCSMDSGLNRDVPPYVTAAGHMAEPRGINSEGLRRRGFGSDDVAAIRRAYKLLYRSDLKLAEAIAEIRAMAAEHEPLRALVEFLESSQRSIIR